MNTWQNSTTRKRRGFTFIELLVVVALMGMLTTIAVVAYIGVSQQSRDSRRKRDLAAIQTALEIYKSTAGSYPNHTTCSGSATWPGCTNPWIAGLTDEYISQLPVDPKTDAAGQFIANQEDTYDYNYVRVGPTEYRLITRLENENDAAVNGSSYGYSGDGIYVVVSPK